MGNNTTQPKRIDTLIVGAGASGLATAIRLKTLQPESVVCVIDKAAAAGNHNLSGAAMEANCLNDLLDGIADWQSSPQAKEILSRKVNKDLVYMFVGKRFKVNMSPFISLARLFGLGQGKMQHKGDLLVSVSRISQWLCEIATGIGVEVLYGFGVKELLFEGEKIAGVIIAAQGLDSSGKAQPNYRPPEKVYADNIVLSEGCDGLATEAFVQKANLLRQANQLYSVGIKEVIKVSKEQYAAFGEATSLHAMGYPLWQPPFDRGIFGGGVMYSMGNEHIAVLMIASLDWQMCDFNPQDALTHFKNTEFVSRFIEGGKVVEAGAKMIPEGGYFALPRCQKTGSIGKDNVIITGDAAGFVDMQKIKGLHNAIYSGIFAAEAIAKAPCPSDAAAIYTSLIEQSSVAKELKQAANYRQTIAKFGMTIGLPLSAISKLLPRWKIEPDYKTTKQKKYRLKGNKEYDKTTFASLSGTSHREMQPCHLKIEDGKKCIDCEEKFGSPCITFCPAGVYEKIAGTLKPANFSNCLHCKTCQRKCPFDNIRWTQPEGAGGTKYQNM